ncbi:MAG: TonB-dependent receptor [Kangiellaceae bacterium]|nr:TonB-dependent receptor [Kangiellaceae bacterium]
MAIATSSIFKPSVLTIALFTAGMSAGLVSAAEKRIDVSELSSQLTEYRVALAQEEGSESKVIEGDEEKVKSSEDETSEGERLVITGYRGSLIRSLDQKRHADTVSEHISADDLGSLPDISIADALTRLPGISAVRTGGQAAEINIRGLSGPFILTTMNGREQTSTSGSRSVAFDQYPSELIASGTVYKSQKASLIEGGIAGTVELQTASPLANREEHTFNVNVRGMFNDRADEITDSDSIGNRLSFSYQGKFADDTLGVSLGYARLDQPHVSTQFIGLHYDANEDFDNDDIPDIHYSEGLELQHKGGTELRQGYVAAIEWAPTEDFVLKTDAFISKFDSEQFARGFRVKFGGPSANYYNPVFEGNNVIGATVVRTPGSWTRVEIVNDDDTKISDIKNYGMNAQWNLTNQFTLAADATYSTADSDFQNRLLWSYVTEDSSAANPVFDSNVAINYQLNGLNNADVSFNQDFTNLGQVMAAKYGSYPYIYSDDLRAFKLDGVYEFNNNDWFSSVEMGYRYSERDYSRDRAVFQYGDEGAVSSTEGPYQLTADVATSTGFSGEFAHFPDYLAIDIDAVLAGWLPGGAQAGKSWDDDWTLTQSGNVYENITAGYFQANIDTEIGNTPVTGNIGLRVVYTDQSATTLQDVGGDVTLGAQNIIDDFGVINGDFAPGILGVKFTDYLPSMNLNFKITDNSQIRVAAARVMSRPPIERLSSTLGGTYSELSSDIETVARFDANNDNNPTLRPFKADQLDISYEYYFDKTDGAFVAAVFYKDIKSFIDTFATPNYDFAGNGFSVLETYIDPDYDDQGSGVPAPELEVINGTYTTAVNNTEGGYMAGLELAYTQVFSMLPEPWSGLGVTMSYAYTDSEVSRYVSDIPGEVDDDTRYGGTTLDIPVEGLSRDVISATLFYEYKNFETRINARYRSEFVHSQIAVNRQVTYFDAETVLDYQASYAFNDYGTILFQVNNLTDQSNKSYFGSRAQTGTIQLFGRQFFLGMTYQF